MKSKREVELELHELSREFDTRPSLAPFVMRRVREQTHVRESTGSKSRDISLLIGTRYARAFGIAVVLGMPIVLWFVVHDRHQGVAFAQVKQAVQRVDSVVMVCEYRKLPWHNSRQYLRADHGAMRIEMSNVVTVTDFTQGRSLLMNTKSKTAGSESAARRITNYFHTSAHAFSTPREFLDHLSSVETEAVKVVREEEFTGGKHVCIELPRDDFLRSFRLRSYIWVDSGTRLPDRFEIIPEAPDDLAASFLQYVIKFTFNSTLDDSLFSMKPPRGYTVLTHDAENLGAVIWKDFARDDLPLPPKDRKLASPIVTLGTGIGAAQFGMQLDLVLQHLGEPDKASKHCEPTPEEEKRRDEAYQKAKKEAAEKELNNAERQAYINDAMNRVSITTMRPANGMYLDEYVSRGFSVITTKENGLMRIFCNQPYSSMRPFTGQTAEGIGIGAAVEDVEKVYGEGDFKDESLPEGDGSLFYKRLNAVFDFSKGNLQSFSLDTPRNRSELR